jgi:hypothetical protein
MQPISALDKLSEKYLVNFGNPQAPTKITEYFSFHCPHCIAIFRRDFKDIQKKYIDSNEIYWTFHPIPTDLVTAQGMVCLERLDGNQKKLFLEAILEETDIANPQITVLLMQKAMELLGNPIPLLQSDEFLEQSSVFQDAFTFLKQKEQISAVPTVEVNSRIYLRDIPDFEFIRGVMQIERTKK